MVCPRLFEPKANQTGSDALLPLSRIAAAVETCDDEDGFVHHPKEQTVRKLAQPRTPHVRKNNGELKRVDAQALYDEIHLTTKTRTKARSFALVPLLRRDHFYLRGRHESDVPRHGQRRASSTLS